MSYQNYFLPEGDDTTGTGGGPGLLDPDDKIWTSDSA
jgi:hypothetical protein